MNTPRRENAKAIFTKSKTNYEVQGKSQGRTKLVGLERYQEILKKYILKKKFENPKQNLMHENSRLFQWMPKTDSLQLISELGREEI